MVYKYIIVFGLFFILFCGPNRDLPKSQNFPVENQRTDKKGNYPIVDTGQVDFYDNFTKISKPQKGEACYGQDAHFLKNPPSYEILGEGMVLDKNTGLIWQKSFEVLSYAEAIERLRTFSLGGKTDWRLPRIKELYSLVLFNGIDASSRNMSEVPPNSKPFLDSIFAFKYGSNGERPIDTQLLSSSVYHGKTMGGQDTVFGLNVADGRIKGYPIIDPRSGKGKKFTVRYVRGSEDYGLNHFQDNKNGTISDLSTGLMWDKNDSGTGMNWESALEWVQKKNKENYLGYSDWRLPNAKELHSIVDYSRSPQSTDSAAIDPIFNITKLSLEKGFKNYPFFWTSTTHVGQLGAGSAVYISFGEALGYMGPPIPFAPVHLMDVHGAGAQRSDPKQGDPSIFPRGFGPQGDVIRIYNFIRLVRDI